MTASANDTRRAGKLHGLFKACLAGERQLRSSSDARLFIEALQAQQPPSRCIESIIASPSGRDAFRDCLRADLSYDFITSHTVKLMDYLSDSGIKALADGRFLRELLVIIVEPPTLLRALIDHYMSNDLPGDALTTFAWLIIELLSLPTSSGLSFVTEADSVMSAGHLLQSDVHRTREYAYQIQKVLAMRSGTAVSGLGDNKAGGRHDNDFEDFRQISIYPTTDEVLSTKRPFYLTSDEVFEQDDESLGGVLLGNHYRLLREDMLAELREDLHVAQGKKKGKRTAIALGDLVPTSMLTGKRCSLVVKCYKGLEFLKNIKPEARKSHLKDKPNILKHQAFGVLATGDTIHGFAFIVRELEFLAADPPQVVLQFTDTDALGRALLALKFAPNNAQFHLVDTPVFAYEPVLERLKDITELPLEQALLRPGHGSDSVKLGAAMANLVAQIRDAAPGPDGLVQLPSLRVAPHKTKPRVDTSQRDSIANALSQSVTEIQGPPGTGKSFTGAQIADYLHTGTNNRILVIAYTNHALDQFLEDLINVGIPKEDMVRLGSKHKCTPATAALHWHEQQTSHRLTFESRTTIDNLKIQAGKIEAKLDKALKDYKSFSLSWLELVEYLEFADEMEDFKAALQVPVEANGWSRAAGKKGKTIGPDYLFERWTQGHDRGVFEKQLSHHLSPVWAMDKETRQGHLHRWSQAILKERIDCVKSYARQYDEAQSGVTAIFDQKTVHMLQSKRVIGCTTTGAANFFSLIRAANPDVVLVEEAGEILESHILTALTPSVKQLILIGDHKQLRPKVNNYALTVEKGDGFDLNRSLFERLIIQGAPHTTLCTQHRMATELSLFPRALTYPELKDGPKTHNRPLIRGLRDRYVFINHTKPETQDGSTADRRDPDTKASKQNLFEAQLILRCVKYLAQQGYGSENMVVLTPYLGQLRMLRDIISKEMDPVLNDLDAAELIRAGISTAAAGKVAQHKLRISTIDNYQGEESDIVIVSLTRSNGNGDIGFMKAPERLNVTITRARNCLIMVGNMETFMKSRQGKQTWVPFFELLKKHDHLYDGLPVKCEKHPERIASLAEPADFDKHCPDGGCAEICGAPFKCGLHKCQRRCHRIADHSQADCNQRIERTCDRQHRTKVQCRNKDTKCFKCVDEDKAAERRAKRDLELEMQRQERQAAYAQELQLLQDELDHQRRLNKYRTEEAEQKKTLEQHRADITAAKETADRILAQKTKEKDIAVRNAARSAAASQKKSSEQPLPRDSAEAEWERLKEFELAASKPMDDLMAMIGLEDVKQAFLDIKSRVDTSIRQDLSLAKERFSCSLLGNPGTGKTTVARLYARFLTDMGLIPGSQFEETTGARLANIGVSGCKKLIDKMLDDGGGVLFIDEAYQLTSGNSPGGGGVLDYLLPEVENLTGKMVFVLAGYNKQMESFFAHNPGLPSRFPIDIKFADYTDDELLRIMESKIDSRSGGRMKCEDGPRGLYCRIVSRRVGRGRGREGFGNARTIENTLSIIYSRQSTRFRKERRAGVTDSDEFLLTKEDLIGPEPSHALQGSKAWMDLQKLIGLSAVKEAVKALIDSIQQNYHRELEEQPPIEYTLNKVFLGSPGTGKTTVANLYGQILVDLGLLSKSEVIKKVPSDFIGGALGQSEQQTKGVLAAASGKVLVIDEAYGLYGGGSTGGTSDPYKTAVIDCIVGEVQSVPGDDRCVLLLGYREQMEEMFQNVNPGLSRRFPISSAFNFEDFDDAALRQILDLKLKSQGFKATAQAKTVAMEMLSRARNRPNFGNAGEIDIILNDAKARHQSRFSKSLAKDAALLDAIDFDENFDRAERSETNVRKLFEGTVAAEQVISLLEGYQETVRSMRALDMDPRETIPFNFLFRGPPGTGKTTTARKMGKVFYDMGFLANADVVECSTTDLIGQYVGQTGPKVVQQLDKALGRVLFIDEAYRLSDSAFGKEVINEIVDSTTKERYHKKLIVILAGYEKDINQLMSTNPGLTSRFPEVIDFHSLDPTECTALLLNLLTTKKAEIARNPKAPSLNLDELESPSPTFHQTMLTGFADLIAADNWASARDVQTIARSIFSAAIKSKTERMKVTTDLVTAQMNAMLKERRNRAQSSRDSTVEDMLGALQLQPQPHMANGPHAPRTQMATATSTKTATASAPPDLFQEQDGTDEDWEELERPRGPDITPPQDSHHTAKRDAGVSDAVWAQLQRDRQAEEEREQAYQQLVEDKRRAATDAAREKIVRRLIEEEKRRKAEEEMRKKLAMSGVCCMGYAWIKQATGYRCAGGSHYMDDAALRAM